MSFFATARSHYLPPTAKKDGRRNSRRRIGTAGWIRLDGGFATRPCNVLDLSDTGVRISADGAATITGGFTFLLSRDRGARRRARVKWKQGSQIGAEFV